ncbi:hypothetical protein RM844_30395 [Streptomyces sp. DSM 44915]|uniref:Uncharacterized protein n=1 Tax=Streptomyces chisholmiae TaxID=3075540 RepID=A0ABU2K0J6_9ACTN|nr:hypothetical protein [Streptomyces sp. DSM 44915]MDT0270592.1 hypothetical protein [Streptomyces sp. DSM 44915]
MRVTAGRLEEDKPAIVEQPADISVTSSTTLVSTDLAVPVVAGAYYIFRVRTAYGASSAGGARFAWTVPTGTTMVRRVEAPADGSSGAGGDITMRARDAGTEQTVGGGITFAGYHEDCQVNVGSVGGVCTLRFAQATSNATATIFRNQSFIEYLRIR